MTDEVAITVREDNVLEIVLNRPEAGNALTPAMSEAISAAVTAPGDEVRVILIRAEGADFCTGRSAVMPEPGARLTALDLRTRLSDPVLDFYSALRAAPVPVIAAVQGRAEGVGCALAVLADVAIAHAQARFCVPEMDRDIAPTLVMDALCDRLGRAAFARMVLTRDSIGAEEAKTLGLVGLVADDVVAEAARVTGKLATNSPATLRAVKAFLARAPEASHATRTELAALLNATATAERFR